MAKKWIQIVVMWLVIAGLMLNPDWIVDYVLEPVMFFVVGYLVYKLIKEGK